MSVPFIDFKEQNRLIKDEVDAGFKKVFEKGDYILGEQVKIFEGAFAQFCEASYGVGVNSGTDALHLALMALDIKEGDEVILPAHTFIATALCVSFCRAKPVFVDINPDTYNIDPKAFQAAITRKTKAVIPVHIYGQPADMDEIIALPASTVLKSWKMRPRRMVRVIRANGWVLWGTWLVFLFTRLKVWGPAGMRG